MNEYSDDDLAAVKDELAGAVPPVAAGIPPGADGHVASTASATEVDPAFLMQTIKAMQERLDTLEAERRERKAPVLTGTAEALRELVAVHGMHHPGTDFSKLSGLADDAVDAAKNAVGSGDGSVVRALAAKIERALHQVHPGPGDHHYFAQALTFAAHHLPNAVDELDMAPRPSAGAVGGGRPVPVVAGSVTG